MPAGYTLMLFLHWTGAEPFLGFNRLVFWVFLPIKLFQEIYRSDFDGVFQTEMLLYGVISVLIIYVLDWVVVRYFVRDRRDTPTLIQMVCRSNYVLFGLSVAENMYPDENLSLISVMAAFVVPMFNILAVLLFEVFRESEKLSALHLLIGIAKSAGAWQCYRAFDKRGGAGSCRKQCGLPVHIVFADYTVEILWIMLDQSGKASGKHRVYLLLIP